MLHGSDFVNIYTNHNRALEAMDSSSRYCKIIHADDWLYPECLERMVAVAERHPYTRNHPAALSSFTYQVYSFPPLEGLLLIRFGQEVLSRDKYRATIRRWLWRYGSWLAKQMLKPTRWRQKIFHTFHAREIDRLIAESSRDPETRFVLSAYRRTLLLPYGDTDGTPPMSIDLTTPAS